MRSEIRLRFFLFFFIITIFTYCLEIIKFEYGQESLMRDKISKNPLYRFIQIFSKFIVFHHLLLIFFYKITMVYFCLLFINKISMIRDFDKINQITFNILYKDIIYTNKMIKT
jgi:hypothetical protein